MQQASDNSVIISEILDPRTKNLLSMSKISDYVLSNELVSMALAMVAEDRQINDVLEELFAEEVCIPAVYETENMNCLFLIQMIFIPETGKGKKMKLTLNLSCLWLL